MRFADLVKLALTALSQQKMRTLLTTLGVLSGTFVLASSLSVGQGVQDTISRESRRHGNLRRVEVWPIWGARADAVPEEAIRVTGAMSTARREKFRETLRQRWMRDNGTGLSVPLDAEHLRQLAEFPFVERVVPLVQMQGWFLFNGRSVNGSVTGTRPENPHFRDRLVAGEAFTAPDEKAALVSEFFLYRCGLTDEADCANAIGKTLRLEFRPNQLTPGLTLTLVTPPGSRKNSREDEQLLAKVVRQLPGALGCFDLSQEEHEALKAIVKPAVPAPVEPTLVAEFVVKGVYRLPAAADWIKATEPGDVEADVVIPQESGEALIRDGKPFFGTSYGYAIVTVTDEEFVRVVMGRILTAGYRVHAPIEFIERERFQYLMIFVAMACVAGVALLVAALGIANTMLMSVLERTREVGVMKAVGASDRHIRRMFLIEGGLIGLVGGGLGVLAAWAVSFPLDSWIRSLVSRQMKIDLKESIFVYPAWLTLGCVAFAWAITTAAAVYPAHRAARVNPITALRHE